MSPDEILQIAEAMAGSCQGTVVPPSGETPGIADKKLGLVIKRIKNETGLVVTVSV